MIILIVDDQQIRHDYVENILGKSHTVLHAFGFDDAIEAFKGCQEKIDLLLLDHDIYDFVDERGNKVVIDKMITTLAGTRERTGKTVLEYVVNNLPEKKWPTRIIIHSHNVYGGENIASVCKERGIPSENRRFHIEMIKALHNELMKPE